MVISVSKIYANVPVTHPPGRQSYIPTNVIQGFKGIHESLTKGAAALCGITRATGERRTAFQRPSWAEEIG
jgi:hypothetical protein